MLSRILFVSFFTILGIIFYQYSEIDLIVSGYFYNPIEGFYLKDCLFALASYSIVRVIVCCFVVGGFGAALHKYIKTKSLRIKDYTKIIYVMLVFAIGPGLVVNKIFKDNFGRARPLQIEQFGGAAKFTPAFVITDQCNTNCSFVSGHSSMGYVFFAFAFLYNGIRRTQITIIATIAGLSLGLGRIMQGAHFLSDVIFCGVFTYITAYILAYIMLKSKYHTNSH